MGTQKSHFAYRLAWENTSSERIPFLPLHRRDLVSAEEGNKTFVGGGARLINWKKFEILGEVIVGIQRSQGTPYPNVARNEDIQRLILEGRFCKDDDVSFGLYLSFLCYCCCCLSQLLSISQALTVIDTSLVAPSLTFAACRSKRLTRASLLQGTLRPEYTTRAPRNRRKRQEKVQLVSAVVYSYRHICCTT